MGGTDGDAVVCMACGSGEGARERPVPLRTVACDVCWDDAVRFPGREPQRVDVALAVKQLRPAPVTDPRKGNAASCKDCGLCALGIARSVGSGSYWSRVATRQIRFRRVSGGVLPVMAPR